MKPEPAFSRPCGVALKMSATLRPGVIFTVRSRLVPTPPMTLESPLGWNPSPSRINFGCATMQTFE